MIAETAPAKDAKLPDRDFFSVPELARSLAIDQAKVLGWIHRGELRAIDVSERCGGRPRWRIPADAWRDFQAARANVKERPTRKTVRRPRRRQEPVETFY